MAASENRLMALTYVSAYLNSDEFQIKAIEESMTKDELVAEMAEVALILAHTVGMFMNPNDPKSAPDVMETLRRIANEK